MSFGTIQIVDRILRRGALRTALVVALTAQLAAPDAGAAARHESVYRNQLAGAPVAGAALDRGVPQVIKIAKRSAEEKAAKRRAKLDRKARKLEERRAKEEGKIETKRAKEDRKAQRKGDSDDDSTEAKDDDSQNRTRTRNRSGEESSGEPSAVSSDDGTVGASGTSTSEKWSASPEKQAPAAAEEPAPPASAKEQAVEAVKQQAQEATRGLGTKLKDWLLQKSQKSQ